MPLSVSLYVFALFERCCVAIGVFLFIFLFLLLDSIFFFVFVPPFFHLLLSNSFPHSFQLPFTTFQLPGLLFSLLSLLPLLPCFVLLILSRSLLLTSTLSLPLFKPSFPFILSSLIPILPSHIVFPDPFQFSYFLPSFCFFLSHLLHSFTSPFMISSVIFSPLLPCHEQLLCLLHPCQHWSVAA